MTPEDELVAATDGDPRPLSPAACDLAERERLTALLGHRADAPAAWQAQARRTLVHAIHAQDLTSRWIASLRGLPVILLKGIALAERVYDSPAERPMGDVDLLVPPARWHEACAAVPGEEMIPPGRPITARHDYCRAFRHPSGLVLEIHRWLTPRPLWPGDPEIFSRAARRDDGALLLSPEDLLLSLCVHAAKHGFVMPLRAVVDTRRVVQRLAPDPAIVADRARRWSASRATEIWLARCRLGGFLGATASVPRGGRLLGIVRAGDSPRQGLAYLAQRVGFRVADTVSTLLGRA
jgi:Uncharacterised nucleotidyltransferase